MTTTTFELKEVRITETPQEITITPVWSGVECAENFSWGLLNKPGRLRLALRLKQAILDGAVLTNRRLDRTTTGKTYVAYDIMVFARHMNADLKRLGY